MPESQGGTWFSAESNAGSIKSFCPGVDSVVFGSIGSVGIDSVGFDSVGIDSVGFGSVGIDDSVGFVNSVGFVDSVGLVMGFIDAMGFLMCAVASSKFCGVGEVFWEVVLFCSHCE